MADRSQVKPAEHGCGSMPFSAFDAWVPISPDEQADYRFAAAMIDEARRARLKFPPPNTLLAAMLEEAGEVATALMDLQNGKGTRADYEAECVQLAALALRLAREGDPGFPASLPASEPLADSDIAAFLADCTLADPLHRVAADDLYRAYCAWCVRRGQKSQSCHGFLVGVTARGFTRSGVSIRFWNGLALKPAAPAQAGEEAL